MKLSPKGFTLLETLIAMGIFAVVLVGASSYFRQALTVGDTTRGSAAVTEVQQGIRRDVYRLVHNFLLNAGPACGVQAPTFATLMSGTLPSGIAMTYLDDPRSKQLLLTVPTGAAYESYKGVLMRCAALPNPDRINGLIGVAGLAFCLQFQSTAAIQSDTSYSLLTQQPVVGEFYYSNVNAVSGAETTCPALRATIQGGTYYQPRVGRAAARFVTVAKSPTLGILYYTFHWYARNATGNPYRSFSGMVSLANGAGAPL